MKRFEIIEREYRDENVTYFRIFDNQLQDFCNDIDGYMLRFETYQEAKLEVKRLELVTEVELPNDFDKPVYVNDDFDLER